MVNKDEEIRDLLSGKIYRFYADEFTDGKRSVAEVFRLIGKRLSITRADVLAYVRANGLPEGLVRSAAGPEDGDYMVQQPDGRVHSYAQERGAKEQGATFPTMAAAMDSYVNRQLDNYFD